MAVGYNSNYIERPFFKVDLERHDPGRDFGVKV
jgi:hypothetical protein